MEVYHSAGMRRTSNWLIKNVIIAFVRAFIGNTDRTAHQTYLPIRRMEQFRVVRAVDDAVARLGYQAIKQKQREAIEAFTKGEDVFVEKFEKHKPSTVGWLTVQNSPLSMVSNDLAAQSALMLLPHS